jgi:Protein of unknown function (DUF2380)
MPRLVALLLAAAASGASAQAGPARLAVAELDFTDTSGEVGDLAAEHALRMTALADRLRQGLAGPTVEVVALACPEPCTGGDPGIEALSAAAGAAGARYLLVGQARKISTLIGTIYLGVIDLGERRVACDRVFSYRGDNDAAWARAADFAIGDIAANCLP